MNPNQIDPRIIMALMQQQGMQGQQQMPGQQIGQQMPMNPMMQHYMQMQQGMGR